jgi:hypothetical protein
MLDQYDRTTTLGRDRGTHHAGGTRTDHRDIKLLHARRSALLLNL